MTEPMNFKRASTQQEQEKQDE